MEAEEEGSEVDSEYEEKGDTPHKGLHISQNRAKYWLCITDYAPTGKSLRKLIVIPQLLISGFVGMNPKEL